MTALINKNLTNQQKVVVDEFLIGLLARLLLSRDLYLLEPTRVNVIMETLYEIDNCVRGFHVYKESWNLGFGCSEAWSVCFVKASENA